MSDFGSSNLPPGAKTAQIGQAALRQTIVLRLLDLPEGLRNVASPQRVEGQVIARGGDQNVVVRTQQGDITLKDSGNPRLQAGDRVAIDIPPGNPPKQAVLKGYLPQGASPPVATPSLPPAVPNTPTAPPPGSGKPILQAPNILPQQPAAPPVYGEGIKLPIPLGQPLRLTPAGNIVLPQLPQQNVTLPLLPQILPPLTSGTLQLPARLPAPPTLLQFLSGFVPPSNTAQSLQLPQGMQATLPPLPNPPGQPVMTRQAQAAIMPSQSSAHDMPVLQLATFTGIPVNAFTGTATPLIFASNVQPGSLLAQVVGFTARQQPVLQLLPLHAQPAAARSVMAQQPMFILHFPQGDMATGEVVQLGVPLSESLPPDALKTRMAAAMWWQPGAFDDMTVALSQAAPQMAQLLEAQLPRAGAGAQHFSGAAAFILSAMQGGIGEFLEGGDDLLAALVARGALGKAGTSGADQQAPSARVSDNDGQSWRVVPLPVLAGQAQIDKVQLYVADDPERKRERATRERALRFIMAAKLSRMGDMQLEGLYQEEKKQLDLQVRSEHPFSSPAQAYIGKLYAGALNRSELTGEIFFQLKRTSWHEFTAPMLAGETVLA